MNRFRENTVDMRPEIGFKAECHAPGSAAHSARQVDKQRMSLIDFDFLSVQLFFQTFAGSRVSKEQICRIFIIHKMTEGIVFRFCSAGCHCLLIVLNVFFYRGAFFP